MNPTCSVVIITKNREYELLECLASIFVQTHQPNEIIIVDNDSNDETTARVHSLAKVSHIPIRLLVEKRAGYPVLRNTGFAAAKFEWIVSIDDDCVADPQWLASFISVVKKSLRIDLCLGDSYSYYPRNSFALANQLFENMWKKNSILKNKLMNFDILDTKNCAFKKGFLQKHKIKFDSDRAQHAGAAEDSDLGLQIAKAKGQGTFVPGMKVLHKNPTTFSTYFSKLRLRYDSRVALNTKWINSTGSYVAKTPERFSRNFAQICKQNKLSQPEALNLLLVSVLSILFSKLYWGYPRVFKLFDRLYQYV